MLIPCIIALCETELLLLSIIIWFNQSYKVTVHDYALSRDSHRGFDIKSSSEIHSALQSSID